MAKKTPSAKVLEAELDEQQIPAQELEDLNQKERAKLSKQGDPDMKTGKIVPKQPISTRPKPLEKPALPKSQAQERSSIAT